MADDFSLDDTQEESGEGEDILTIPLDETIASEPFDYDPNADNLVAAFAAHPTGQEWLKDFVDDVLGRFDTAYDSSEEYRERFAELYKIFAADIPDKEYPFENAAKAHVPILVAGVTRLASHTMVELFPDREQVFGVQPTGPDDQQIAEVLTLHGNWQIRNQIPDFMRQMDRGSLLFFLAGDVTGHSFYDPITRNNRHEVLTCDEFFIPYSRVTTMPDYSDVPFKFKVIDYYDFDLERLKGDWDEEAVESVLKREPPSYDDDPEGKLRWAIAEAQGIIAPESDANAPYRIYQYEGMSSLPAIDGGDEGPQRALCAFIDPRTKAVLKLYVREQVDWRDKVREERQQQELQGFQQADQQHQDDLGRIDELQQMGPHPQGSQPDLELATRQASVKMGPPQPPSWAEMHPETGQPMPPEPARMVPIEMFSHGVNIENLLGALGLSQGHQLAEHNKTADTVLSQFIDSATLANNWSLVVPDTLTIEPGSFEIAPGRINQIPGVSGPDLRSSIVELKPQPANQQLVDVVRMMEQYGQEAASAPDVLSGAEGKSGETFRGISSRIQQATKQLSKSGQKFADWVTQVFRNNGVLNSKFLPEDEMYYVLDHLSGEMKGIRVGRQMYERNYQVTIVADMQFRSQAERVSEADELIGLPKAVPPLAGNTAYWHAATTRALRARQAHDMVALLGPAPPMPTTPFGLPPPMPPGMMPPPGAPPGPPGAGPPGRPPGPPPRPPMPAQRPPARPAA